MTCKYRLRQPGSSLLLRLFALGVLAAGTAGLVIGEMPAFEAGRLYLVAAGLYLIAPVEKLPKQERRTRLLLSRPRYLAGALSVTCAIAIIFLQFVAQILKKTGSS